jgi:hydrophobic/amphiphilic exporter-1 (mainly G- bacteria), HAE1 family
MSRSSLLPRISVTRPVTVAMCLVALLVIGAVSYNRIRLQAFPSGWEYRYLWVWVDWPDTSPQEKDQQISRLFMDYLSTVKHLRQIRTWAGRNWSDAQLAFRPEADMSLAYNQVMDRVERIRLELPTELQDNIGVWKHNSETDQAVIWMGVTIPDGVGDKQHFLERQVQAPLERIDGVAKVNFWGAFQKHVKVELDRDRMGALGVKPHDLVRSLQGANFSRSGGFVSEGGKRYYVRSLARYQSIEEIQNTPIRRLDGGGGVKLKDVATVSFGSRDRHWRWRINGKDAIGFDLYKDSDANLVEVCDRVVAALDDVSEKSGAGFQVFWNQGKIVRDSLGNLRNTGLWGGLFAAMVLFFFLRTLRMTAIITLSIPLCVMIAMSALYFIDWSLNILTMMGMMVGLGMVVDNSIVIVENIYRMRAKGDPPGEASIKGASEVGLAISMATLTTVVVFLPLMFMSGNVNLTFNLTRIGVPVITALLGSLFVALIFIPLAAKVFGDNRVSKEPRSILKVKGLYQRGLRWTMAHRRDAVVIVLALFATVIYPYQNVKKTGHDERIRDSFFLRSRMAPFMSFEQVGEIALELEAFLDTKREQYNAETVRLDYWRGSSYGGIHARIHLKEESNKEWWYQFYKSMRRKAGYPVETYLSRVDAIKDLKKTIPRYVGVETTIETWRSNRSGVSVYLYGEDLTVLVPLLEEVERRISAIPSVVNVDSDLEFADTEVQVIIDREKAHHYGISARTVGQNIAYQLRGTTSLPRYQSGDREVQVRVQTREEDRKTLTQLKAFAFESSGGEEIPLSSFAQFKVARGSGTIRREDGKMRLAVKAYTTKEDLKGLYAEVDRAMDGFIMPRGYTWNKGESYSKFREQQDTMDVAVTMAVTCVFLLMGVLFESFVLPFSVLLSIPFAFFGVYWINYLTGTVMGNMAQMGNILLIGVVVNNAIVLVDMVNRLRGEGMDRHEAIMEAGANRFRPILMTTFTTVCGLLPMALGSSGIMGTPYAPMGITMIGGLLASTFLSLFVVPLFYTFFDDLRIFVPRVARGALSREKQSPTEIQPADD